MSTRTVIVNERAEPATATPFESADAARYWLIPLVDQALTAEGLRDEYPADLSTLSLEQLGEVDSGLMALAEGSLGVWTGFSSSDRWAIGGPFPYAPGEWLGSGDPHVYLTAGQVGGTAVPAAPDDVADFE